MEEGRTSCRPRPLGQEGLILDLWRENTGLLREEKLGMELSLGLCRDF